MKMFLSVLMIFFSCSIPDRGVAQAEGITWKDGGKSEKMRLKYFVSRARTATFVFYVSPSKVRV